MGKKNVKKKKKKTKEGNFAFNSSGFCKNFDMIDRFVCQLHHVNN